MSQDLVSTQLNYSVPPADGSKPWSVAGDVDPETGQLRGNYSWQSYPVQIENIRGKESEFTLQTSGFAYHVAPTSHTNFDDDEAIKASYYPESEEWLKKLTGAKHVVLFDHTVRRNKPGDIDDTPQNRHPVPRVHVDQTPTSASTRVRRHVPEDADKLLQGRFQIVNLWRPIAHPAADFPLALCDFRTVDAEREFLASTVVFPTYEGETFIVKHSPNHRWKYARAMRPEEIVLIKCYDSDSSGATFTPHTAFTDPTTPKDAPLRQSIELRTLLFY